MMIKRRANAHWKGNLTEGKGELTTPSNILNNTSYSFKTRTDGLTVATNPEELIAAAHAGCFTMGLSAILTQSGFTAGDLNTEAVLEADFNALKITGIQLVLHASKIEGLSAEQFNEIAEAAKVNCLISKSLNVPISLTVSYN